MRGDDIFFFNKYGLKGVYVLLRRKYTCQKCGRKGQKKTVPWYESKDMENIAKVIAANTGKKINEVTEAMLERTTLNPEKAKKWGLVHEIKSELFASGQLHTFGESNKYFRTPQQGKKSKF